jgi:hypothetical protein
MSSATLVVRSLLATEYISHSAESLHQHICCMRLLTFPASQLRFNFKIDCCNPRVACSPQAAVRQCAQVSNALTLSLGADYLQQMDQQVLGRDFGTRDSAPGSNEPAVQLVVSSLPFRRRSGPPVPRGTSNKRKGLPKPSLQGDILDYPPAVGYQIQVSHMQQEILGNEDPLYIPSLRQKGSGCLHNTSYQLKASTRPQRKRAATFQYSPDAVSPRFSKDESEPTNVGELAVRRSKRQRKTVTEFQGYNESLAQELLEEDQAQQELQEKAPPPRRSDVFKSREEALLPLAKELMRITGCTSLNLSMEMANDLAKYKHPPLPEWPRATPHVS